MNFVRQHKYIDNEVAIFDFISTHNPKNIVELGYGSGALTVAMSYAVNDGNIYSYDLKSPATVEQHLNSRNLKDINNHVIIQGDVFKTFINNPVKFDLLLIDIDNTWELIYDIIFTEFVYNQISNGSIVLIEGGSDIHPRMNKNTLRMFNDKKGKKIFDFSHMSGKRTSISRLYIA